jgi:hypothetical protein
MVHAGEHDAAGSRDAGRDALPDDPHLLHVPVPPEHERGDRNLAEQLRADQSQP